MSKMDEVSNKQVEHLRWIANTMDAKFKGPFGFRFGWDAIIGLIPGIGDLITTLISFYMIASSYQLGVGPAIITRMLINQGIDSLVGSVPFFGDLFDAGFKAQLRNMKLIDQYMLNPKQVKQKSWALLIAMLFAFFILLFGFFYTLFWLGRFFVTLIYA